jgi:hypothetical protein
MADGSRFLGNITMDMLDAVLGPLDITKTKLDVQLIPVCLLFLFLFIFSFAYFFLCLFYFFLIKGTLDKYA